MPGAGAGAAGPGGAHRPWHRTLRRAVPRRTGCRPPAALAAWRASGAAGPGRGRRGAAGAVGSAESLGRRGCRLRHGRCSRSRGDFAAGAAGAGRSAGGGRRLLRGGLRGTLWAAVSPKELPQTARDGCFHRRRRGFKTNSPCSLSRARTSLLVTPSSLANSCTRACLPLHLHLSRRQRWSRLGSAMTHGHRDFTVCSCSSFTCSVAGRLSALTCSTTAEVSGEPAMRNARVKARRRIASCRHRGRCATTLPNPGGDRQCQRRRRRIDRSPSTPPPPGAVRRPTHPAPMQVRTGAAEISRSITAQSTVSTLITEPVRRPGHPARRRRCGCRSASRSATTSRAFWPSLPMARESWKSGAITRAARAAASMTWTETTFDGDSALATNWAGSSSKSMMSIFSPDNSLITLRTR